MATLIGLLMSPLGRLVGAGLGILLALSAWRAFDLHKQRGIGEARAHAKMEEAGNANAAKAEKARKSVDKIPDAKLDDRYRRD